MYAGYDRFGRTIDQRWVNYSSGTVDVSRLKYGYDYAASRTWREDVVAAANGKDHDEFYTYDGLQRLMAADRGNLTGSPYSGVTSTNLTQDWTLDQLGNWSNLTETDGTSTTLDQDRSHNDVNEITGIDSSSNLVAYDLAGNMTTMPQPLAPSASYLAAYDAWNRLVEVKEGANVVQQKEYDGLGERIVRVDVAADPDVTYHCYYNDQWQLLEERKEVSGTEVEDPLSQYVWHPYYIDALAVRWYDVDTDGIYRTGEGVRTVFRSDERKLDSQYRSTCGIITASHWPLLFLS